MLNICFVIALALGLTAILGWGIRALPAERWQMLAAVPVAKCADGSWRGRNLTFYGFFSAAGTTFGCAFLLLLLSSVGLPIIVSLGLVAFVLLVCIPSSRIIARIVERKSNTFSVAGAAFMATILLPPVLLAASPLLSRIVHSKLAVLPVFAAAAISYALGESIGRLACLSFGCCYGIPLRDAKPVLARLFCRYNLVIEGATKKASYASGLSGEPLIPVQALTSIVYAAVGIAGTVLFLERQFRLAAFLPVLATYGWRAGSEWLRADYRGDTKISKYQVMAIVCVVYLSGFLSFIPGCDITPSLSAGIRELCSAPVILLCQTLWLALFFYYGASRVTSSKLSFQVVADRI